MSGQDREFLKRSNGLPILGVVRREVAGMVPEHVLGA